MPMKPCLKKKNHHHSEDGHPLDFLEAQETSVSSKEAPSLTEGGTGAANSKNLASQNFRKKLNLIQKHSLSIKAPEV